MGPHPPPSRIVIGRYVLHGEIASGGMATVYFGRLVGAAGFSRVVAIKRLHPHLAKDHEFSSMFLDEARLAARVRHPNVVPLLDVAALGDEVLLVMEYVPGVALSTLLGAAVARRVLVPPDIAAAVTCGLLRGLHAAHEAMDESGAPLHIVHRDVSPPNVLVGSDGVARVVDFGVAKAEGRVHTTREGTLKGKLSYMAPEQLRGCADRRTDVYAASVVLWEALTSRRLFKAESEAEVFAAVLTADLQAPSAVASGVPRALDAVTLRGLAREPGDRFPTALAMARAIESAASLASPTRVGEWVTDLARDLLARRAEAVAILERESPSGPPAQEMGAAVRSEEPTSQLTLQAGTLTASGVPPPPRRSRRRLGLALGAVVLACAATAGVALRRWRPRAPASVAPAPAAPNIRLPARVLVLGIENRTGDPVFAGTLDDVLTSALGQSVAMRPEWGTRLRNSLAGLLSESQQVDEAAAARLAARDGDSVVTVRGAVVPKGAGYVLSLAATDAASGARVLTDEAFAPEITRVVPTVGVLACRLRRALGDSAPADPAAEEQTGASAVLEADYESTLAQQFASLGRYDEAIAHLRRALALDPDFERARVALGMHLRNVGRDAEGLRELEVALKGAERLGERERLSFLGNYHGAVGNYAQSASDLETLLQRIPGDVSAETALPGVYVALHDVQKGLAMARRAVADHPTLAVTHSNLAFAELLAGDVAAASAEAQRAVDGFPRPVPHAFVALGVARALEGDADGARKAYERLSANDPALAAAGLADLALSQGRAADAAALLEPGPSAGDDHGITTAGRWEMLAEARLALGDKAGALAAAKRAAALGVPAVTYLASGVALAAGDRRATPAMRAALVVRTPEDRMVVALLDADDALAARQTRAAATHAAEAGRAADTWLVHADLARIDAAAGDAAGASAERAACAARKGEGALSLGGDAPSVRLVTRAGSTAGGSGTPR